MNFLDSEDLIIACSTSNTSNAAISVIRLSGFANLDFLNDCFTTKVKKPRFAYYGSLVNGYKKLDDIVLTFFEGPNSYNGENILELGVHGNILNVKNIISYFIKNKNFRHAYPGEFSYRALRNNKLNLSQIEGLDLLLNANSNYALEQGNSLMSGELKEAYKLLYDSFLNHKSSVELSIDFFEDLGEEQSNKQLKDSFNLFFKVFQSLHSKVSSNSQNLLKPDICLLGKPNSGKSSLFNSLLHSDRAIVSSIEGTTRDFIKENFLFNNILYSLVDTAGIRSTTDEIEAVGIEKALQIFDKSFYKILLIDPRNFESLKLNLKCIDAFIFTHIDLLKDDKLVSKIQKIILENIYGSIGACTRSGSIEPNNINSGPVNPQLLFAGPEGAVKTNGPIEPIFISLNANNPDIGVIKQLQDSISHKYQVISSDNPIIIDRHIDVINKINDLLITYREILFTEKDISIVSSELNIVGHCISELIGIIRPEEVLNNIFDNFCIGK